MARVVGKWTGVLFLAVAALALASLAFELVVVDADVDPPSGNRASSIS